ncbi:MAG TPA: hypothetical protein V6D14_22195 [Coleofasciculaceae cyanobacterium]
MKIGIILLLCAIAFSWRRRFANGSSEAESFYTPAVSLDTLI